MRVFLVILLVGFAASNPAPQLGDLFSSFTDTLSGDDEPGEVNGDYKAVPYTTIQKFKGYEEREYPSVKWACTELTYTPEIEDDEEGEGFNLVKMMQKMMSKSSWKNKPSSKMFMKLFRYISGVNKERKEIPMTVPVLSKRTPREDGSMTTDMCFYIDPENQKNPPEPEDPEVRIYQNKVLRVYVHQFGGYAMKDSVWVKEAEVFATKLADNNDVDLSSFYTAGYDSPMKFWNRRNEVMFVKKMSDKGENNVL